MPAIDEAAQIGTGGYLNSPQVKARTMLRRLMAERNIRVGGVAPLLGHETHTIRRMLNGSRNMALEEVVKIATLGGYSLDEYLLQRPRPAVHQAAAQSEVVELNLSKVFAAIADLLSTRNAASKEELKLADLSKFQHPAREKPPAKPAPAQSSVGTGRPRGRPRKTPLGPDGLPGPRW